jgi:TetR/AcrR family transcriptional regulator, lmrAB and yxaGH operons repressor
MIDEGRSRQRDKIVRATAKLLRERGYAATGLADIIALSGSPKGSLYYYFPEGKDQIAVEALQYAGDLVARTLSELIDGAPTPGEAVRRYGALLAKWMQDSGFRDGCPITTTLLETAPEKSAFADVGEGLFDGWVGLFAAGLEREGLSPARARELGTFAISALEGGLMMARVQRSPAAILLAAEEAGRLFDREARVTTPSGGGA